MVSKNILMLCTVFITCAPALYSMDPPPTSNDTQDCLAIARHYIHQEMPVRQTDLLVSQPDNLHSPKLVKMLLGNQTIVCTMNAEGNPEAFAWSMENIEGESWTVLKLYSKQADKIMNDLIPELYSASPGQGSLKILCNNLPTFPPALNWIFAYSLQSKKYCVSWHEISFHKDLKCTISQGHNHRFFSGDDLGSFSLLEVLIVNIAYVLALKNRHDAWIIQKFLANDQIKKLIAYQ